MKIYVVEMLRWGDTESHHYIVGAFTTRDKAEDAGTSEEYWRGGKYEHRVVEVGLDEFCKEVLEYAKGCK
jgi:hypothetical protein